MKKKKVCETGISLVFPRGHALDRKKPPSLTDIAAYRVVVRRRSSATRRMIDASFAGKGLHPTNILEVGRCQSVMNFVQLGLGVGLVHTICACAEPYEKVRHIDMSRYFDETDVALINRKNSAFGPTHQTLMQALFDSPSARRHGTPG